ncbi:MAG: hypothetical protein ACUVQ2_01725 [Dissulfurimicrobium sp.]|uniref:hypothetical protein n=1 Tax=Dissulfurimicrobium sp. TaxID=2022436 RepID=UPI00404AF716
MSNDQWNVTNSSGAAYPLTIYNADEGEKSLNIYFKNAELNTINPSTLQGRPTNFVDGFIRFTVPNPSHAVHPDGSIGTCQSIASNPICSIRTNGSFYPRYNFILIFSYIDSSLIGAAQTMLGTFKWEFLP